MIYAYILVMALTTYLIRMLPLTLLQKRIQNTFLRSFLFYVPYACLSAMTFPAILTATQSPAAGAAALAAGILAAWLGAGLLPVAAICCGVVFVLELFLC